MIDATPADDESVVGEECHIISGRGQGRAYSKQLCRNMMYDLLGPD